MPARAVGRDCRRGGHRQILPAAASSQRTWKPGRTEGIRLTDEDSHPKHRPGHPPEADFLTRLYVSHGTALFGFLLQFLRHEADARDVMQDVFCKLAGNPELLNGVREPRAFLIRMAHRQAIDQGRRGDARERGHERAAAEQNDTAPVFQPSEDPDEQAFRDCLTAAMVDLPPDQRAVVHLKLWESMTFESIAETLNISPNTAASRYRYAMDKLRERLRPLYDEIK
ncbi:MAG: sigma-70 family RNA polymerase sigma factor [Verrucomicrobia bacterium]|nr:sigma-70 family RNA polymerase sigma factor [Verrucomicrobiota bacterium]